MADGSRTLSPAKSRLTTQHLSPDQLSTTQRDQAFALLDRCYQAVCRDQFDADLAAKDHVLLLNNQCGDVQGFTTIAHDRLRWQGRWINVLFSGDTVIAPEHWGTPALPLAWCRLAGQIKAQSPEESLYWLLIVKGHRTYRYLPLFTHDFAPRHDQPTAPDTSALIDHLARARFCTHWKPETGLVQFPQSRGHLRATLAGAQADQRDNPHIRYFNQRNPGWMQGDELVCLTELSATNMRGMARRSFIAGLAEASA